MPQTILLQMKVDGMHCDACVRRVTSALGKVPGVAVEEVAIGTASMLYDPAKVNAAQIADAVRAIGFGVSEI